MDDCLVENDPRARCPFSRKDQLPPHILTESEEEAVGKLIIRSTSEKETHIPMGSTRSEQIYARIDIITAKGAQSRRKMGASFTDDQD